MHPTDFLLIALLPTPADLVRAQAGWYRLPDSAAPTALWKARGMAFYQPRSFGEEGLQIAWWGRISKITAMIRRELLPDEPNHPRANEPYLRVALEPLEACRPPLRTTKARRLLFASVQWGDFVAATTLDDLFRPPSRPIVDSLLYQLIQPQLEGVSGITPPEEENPHRLLEAEEEWIPDW